jgi:acyl-CoA hydrolase
VSVLPLFFPKYLIGVTYTNETTIHVEVRTDVEDPGSDIAHTSNYFYFTFAVPQTLRTQVMPRLYEEAMKVSLFLECFFTRSVH